MQLVYEMSGKGDMNNVVMYFESLGIGVLFKSTDGRINLNWNNVLI